MTHNREYIFWLAIYTLEHATMNRIDIVAVVISTLLIILAGVHYKWPEMIPGFMRWGKDNVGWKVRDQPLPVPILSPGAVTYIIPVQPDMFGKRISLTYQPTSSDEVKIIVIVTIPGMGEDEKIYSFKSRGVGESIAFKFNGPDGTHVFQVDMNILPYPLTVPPTIDQQVQSSTIPPEIDPEKYDLPTNMVGKSGNQVTYHPKSAAPVSIKLRIPTPGGGWVVASQLVVPTSSKQMIPWTMFGTNTSGTLVILPHNPNTTSGYRSSIPSRPMWRGLWSKK